jgi:hypothetical protein
MVDIDALFSFWIPITILLPLGLGALAAIWPWIKHKAIMGNLLGSFVIAAVIFLLIWQQYGAYVDAMTACSQGLSDCPPSGIEMYTPYLMLVFMGWVDVFLLLIISGVIEDRTKRRWPDPSQL